MSFKIREIVIHNKLVLAPMAGVTNEAFRIICKEMGAGLVMSEMVSDKALVYKNEKTLSMINVSPLEHPISMQIFGSDIESMVKAAIFVDTNSDCDIIDINMGCPVNKVAKRAGAGASLLTDPNKVYMITKSVVEAVKKPVTVKIRIGWDEQNINAVENAKLIEKAGACAIAVHGRTRNQFYSGKANWDIIRQVKEAVNIPVIANGDVIDIKSAEEILQVTKCDALMIGRGILGNPWLFKEIDAYFKNGTIIPRPTCKEIFEVILRQYHMLKELKGEHLATLEMRSHVAWYLKGLSGSTKIKNDINQQKNFDAVIQILTDYFDNLNEKKDDSSL